MKILHILFSVLMVSSVLAAAEEDVAKRKVYEVKYMESTPKGVAAWSQSEMVKKGLNKEDRFVPYNSEAAKKLWLDATTVRKYNEDPKIKGRETEFYMTYDEKGWYIYINCLERNIKDMVAENKGGGELEIFFVPGLQNSCYHQMIVSQPSGKTSFFDWGMPHRFYHSLKGHVTVESQATDVGFATYMFVPWEVAYDRLPLNGDCWRFSFMRWSTGVTWGGQVHHTGNFGLVKFQKPSAEVRLKIEKNILCLARNKFLSTSKKLAAEWQDSKMGDSAFLKTFLNPLIARNTELVKGLGKFEEWNAETIKTAQPHINDWMEFDYVVAEARTQYLEDALFSEK